MPWPSRITGVHTWAGSRDDEGHRTYKLGVQVTTDGPEYGPATVLQTPGLPLPGALWYIASDIDVWAWCRWGVDGPHPMVDGERNTRWQIVFTFSTKPPPPRQQRQPMANAGHGMSGKGDPHPQQPDQGAGDPLLEPPKIRGSSVRYQEDKALDAYGDYILSSSWERIVGPATQFDANRDQVVISGNVAVLNWSFVRSLRDHVNATTMWGLPPRTIKLTDFSWDVAYHKNALVYYQRTLVFDINPETWDRDIDDEGTKCLRGHWEKSPKLPNGTPNPKFRLWVVDKDPNTGLDLEPGNPANFDLYQDWKGENGKVMLDGFGRPWNKADPANPIEPGKIRVQFYKAADLMALGGLPADVS